jgi:tetratricopeptide (TPR) repeat protein
MTRERLCAFASVLFLLGAASVRAEDPRVTELVSKGDDEDRQHHTLAAVAVLQQAEKIEPKNLGVLLRLSKQYSDLVSETRGAEAEANARKALEYAQQAVALDPNSAKAHLSLAICYGKLTDFVGNKTKVEYSKRIRDGAQKSLALDPTDDFAWHVLGRWHFGVANVNAVLRAMARVVYGGLPPASNEEAARCLEKACDLAPQRIIHHSELARVYQAMGKRDLAARKWRTVLDLPAVDKEDERDQREARQALAKP